MFLKVAVWFFMCQTSFNIYNMQRFLHLQFFFFILWELEQRRVYCVFYSLWKMDGWFTFLGAALHSRQLCFKMCKKAVLWTLCSYCFSTTFFRNVPVVLLMKKPSKRFTHSSFHREVSALVDLWTYSPLELCLQSWVWLNLLWHDSTFLIVM